METEHQDLQQQEDWLDSQDSETIQDDNSDLSLDSELSDELGFSTSVGESTAQPNIPVSMGFKDILHFMQAFRDNHAQRVVDFIHEWLSAIQRWMEEEHNGNSESDPDKMPQRFFISEFFKLFDTDHEMSAKLNIELADESLAKRYGFSLYEVMILWILSSIQLDPKMRQRVLAVDFNSGGAFSYSIMLQILTTSQKERDYLLRLLSPNSKLAQRGFLHVTTTCNPTLPLSYELRVPQQLAYYFTDVHSLSVKLSRYAVLVDPEFPEDMAIAVQHIKTLETIQRYYTRPSFADVPLYSRNNLNSVPSLGFFVEGTTGSGRSTLIKLIANKLHRSVIIVECIPLLSLNVDSFEEYLELAFWEAELLGCLLCFKSAADMMNDVRMAAQIEKQLRTKRVACAFCIESGQETLSSLDPCISFRTKIEASSRSESEALWRMQMRAEFLNVSEMNLDYILSHFSLHPFQVQNASKLAYYQTDSQDEHGSVMLSQAEIVKAAAHQMKKNIGGLAFISDPAVSMNEVIVCSELSKKLNQIVGAAQNRRKVLEEWGVGKRIKRGTGIIALFDGEPGTGKTHSAEAIAKKLGLSLMRINTASIVDKYIGETEKNLTKIFSQARPDMSLILFDEADSLFSKRTSNVSKSNDRYSNMSINVLLQLIERFEGVSILTTNLKTAIDPAFERRITYKVYFPMPEKPERTRLWKYLCPSYIRTEEPIDYTWLSNLELSGGEIKNAVLTASYRAASLGQYLSTELLYDAAISEASSTGRVMRRGEDV